MTKRFANAYALLIAVDENKEASAALPAVGADARALRDLLVHPQRCAYAPDNVRLLTGTQSTRAAILDSLDWLGERLAAVSDGNATVLIYFSGHGHAEGGEHYLIPYDLNLRRIASSAIRAADFAADVERLAPRRLLVVLDCCHAAGMGVKGAAESPGIAVAAVPPTLFLPAGKALPAGLGQGQGRAVLSSCAAAQRSWVRADGRMSIFTYHFLEALSGRAQPQGGAAEVLVSDLVGHVRRRVPDSARADHQAEQTPEQRLLGDNFPVALVLGGDGLSKGQAAPDPLAPLAAGLSHNADHSVRQASVNGSGAVALQGDALGEQAVKVGGNVYGDIDHSTHIGDSHHHDHRQIHVALQGGAAAVEAVEARAVIAHYLETLVDDLTGLKLAEIDVAASDAQRTPLQLADVYVPLDTQLRIPQDTTLTQWLARDRHAAPGKDAIKARKERPVAALEALAAHRRLTLLGAAGSGKSTFGASILLALAQAWQGHDEALASLGTHWTYGRLLPIRVVLRHFAEQLANGKLAANAGGLWNFIGRDLEASACGLSSQTVNYVRQIARDHGALIVFDGLDECGNGASRHNLLAAVDAFQRSAGGKCRFLLTARPYAWPGGGDPVQGVYGLADLDDTQVENFIRAWYAALAARKWLPAGDAERKSRDLLAARHSTALVPLTRNPLLLTLMATLHASRGRLPDDRADLYNDSVDLLLLRWNRQIGADKALLDELAIPTLKLSHLRGVFEELAFQVHSESAAAGVAGNAALRAAGEAVGNPPGCADIGEDRLIRAFMPLLGGSRDNAAVVVDYIEKRAGLLIGQGSPDGLRGAAPQVERQFTFPHRTFQEFLAARHLASRTAFAQTCVERAGAAPGHWQVVLPLAARLAEPERGAGAADALIGSTPVEEFIERDGRPEVGDWSCALLAGLQLLEIGVGVIKQWPHTRAIARRVAGWLAASLPVHPDEGGADAAQRAYAGDVVCQLGDPRFAPQRFFLPADELLGFVRIDVDPEFMIGTRQADVARLKKSLAGSIGPKEINEALTPTPAFYIARYPVTVAQFRAFVEASHFAVGDDARALDDPDNRPVRYVSRHDAEHYCRWLNEVIATSPALADSAAARLLREGRWQVALPSELEWEKAARGGLHAKLFPWGDEAGAERANCREAQVGSTSAVGAFPANGYGLHDMAGNVWEWTRGVDGSRYESADLQRKDGASGRADRQVVRGGSWSSDHDSARCACRYWYHAGFRGVSVGFRVVLRFPPV